MVVFRPVSRHMTCRPKQALSDFFCHFSKLTVWYWSAVCWCERNRGLTVFLKAAISVTFHVNNKVQDYEYLPGETSENVLCCYSQYSNNIMSPPFSLWQQPFHRTFKHNYTHSWFQMWLTIPMSELFLLKQIPAVSGTWQAAKNW